MSVNSSFNELDSFDISILSILQTDNTLNQQAIGNAVNLSATAVNRRIKRMQKNGVIQSNVAVINPSKVGKFITLLVNVEIENEQSNLIDEIKKKFTSFPEVQQCYYVTGDADFVLIINVPTMAYYEQLTHLLFFDNENVKRFKTFVAMERIKTGLTIPLESIGKL